MTKNRDDGRRRRRRAQLIVRIVTRGTPKNNPPRVSCVPDRSECPTCPSVLSNRGGLSLSRPARSATSSDDQTNNSVATSGHRLHPCEAAEELNRFPVRLVASCARPHQKWTTTRRLESHESSVARQSPSQRVSVPSQHRSG